LRDSLNRLNSEEEAEQARLFLNQDEQRQRQLDIRRMEDRLASLDDEERREIAGIKQRYADVKPYVSTVALVFAIAPDDIATWEVGR